MVALADGRIAAEEHTAGRKRDKASGPGQLIRWSDPEEIDATSSNEAGQRKPSSAASVNLRWLGTRDVA